MENQTILFLPVLDALAMCDRTVISPLRIALESLTDELMDHPKDERDTIKIEAFAQIACDYAFKTHEQLTSIISQIATNQDISI